MDTPTETISVSPLPDLIETEAALDEWLTRPRPQLVAFIKNISSPLVILGAGGKMGPSLAVLAARAAAAAGHRLELIAVSRFTNPQAQRWLAERGVTPLACDLLDPATTQRLPDTENVIYMVGLKFGTAQSPARTWAINTLVPAHVMARYARARVVALSTGNVYPLTPVRRGGSVETDPLIPLGEYANATVGRERIFEFYSQQNRTPVVLLRLFYAVELRYGVLHDLAQQVWAGQPVPLTTGHFNCIWQGDANELILRTLPLCDAPPAVFNLARPEILSVRDVATRLAALLDRTVHFTGTESETALLGNSARLFERLGPPPTPLDAMLRWTAHWVKHGGPSLGKPTHFEVRDGTY